MTEPLGKLERELLAMRPKALGDETNESLAGSVLTADVVAARVVDAILHNELYILTHGESRDAVRRRFERIDRAFTR